MNFIDASVIVFSCTNNSIFDYFDELWSGRRGGSCAMFFGQLGGEGDGQEVEKELGCVFGQKFCRRMNR